MNGLLLLCFDYSKVAVEEFNDWYDTEHIPERQRTMGFLTAQRWIGVENRSISVAVYDLENAEVLRSPGYLAISGPNLSPWSKRVVGACRQLLRFEGTQLYPGRAVGSDAGLLMLVAVGADPVDLDMRKQASLEHAARVSKLPGVKSARAFGSTNSSMQVLELYELEGPEVISSGAWRDADSVHPAGSLSVRANLQVLCSRYRRTTS